MLSRVPERTRAGAGTALALIVLLVGAALPMWKMTLHAPQYPQGLRLVIDGRGIHGDVDELNGLNHYIGMAPISEEKFPERFLFYPAIGALALGLVLSLVVPWRWFRMLVLAGLLAFPVLFLADLQWHLHQFGHSLDPRAPFRLPPFTTRVVGPTVVMNFNVTALPGGGMVLVLLSALFFSLTPRRPVGLQAVRRLIGAPVALGALLLALAWLPPAAGTPAAPAFDLHGEVAAAPPGAVIEVPAGRYAGPLTLARPVTLRGIGRPEIDGGGRGDVVLITGDGVTLEGFVIRGSALAYSREAAGVVVRGDGATVRGNEIRDVLFGVYLAGTRGATVEGNTIVSADLPLERRGHAIYLWKARDVRLLGNRVLRAKDGIYVSFSDDNLAEGNLVTGSRYGIHYMYSSRNTFRANTFVDNVVGAAVMYTRSVTLTDNIFEGSRSSPASAGLIFKDADALLVSGNRIVRNRIGLEFDTTPASLGGWARVEGNLIAFNEVGLSLMSTAAITATGNTIVENLRTVQARGAVRAAANRWAVDGRGNHWGDYTGFDAGGDGVGDVPYRRADLLEDMVDRRPALQAFLYTPAHLALEAAGRVVPLVRMEPVVDDPAPLMRPAAATFRGGGAPSPAAAGVGRASGGGLLPVGLGLTLPAVAALFLLRGGRRR